MTFAEYIRSIRQQSGLTQAAFSQALSAYSEEFTDLDSNTISRWERGTHVPVLSRQNLCIEFSGDDPDKLMPFISPQAASDSLEKVRNRVRRILSEQRFDAIVGGLPGQTRDMNITEYCLQEEDGSYLEFIEDLDRSVLETSSPFTAQHIRKWLERSGSQLLVERKHGQITSHLLLLRLKPESYSSMMNQERFESSLGPEDLAADGETFCFYILSFYSQSQESAADMVIYLTLLIYRNKRYVKRVGTLVGNMDGVKLCRVLLMQIASLGVPSESGGVISDGQKYHSATLDTSTSGLLSGSLARKCVSGAQNIII